MPRREPDRLDPGPRPLGLLNQDDGDPRQLGAAGPLDESWAERDLANIVADVAAGRIVRASPTIGLRSDGIGLFYPGRINSLFGSSGDGKTFVVQSTAVQEITAGNHVLWIDYEDDEIGTVDRLISLGADLEAIVQRFHYIRPETVYAADVDAYIGWLVETHQVTLCVIDSTGEALSIEGLDPDRDVQVAAWMRRMPRSIADLGVCVVIIDHANKAKRGDLYAGGSQRKRAAINGAAYLVEAVAEHGRGRVGMSKLTTAKDRLGNHVRGARAADFRLDATVVPYRAELAAPDPTPTTAGGDFRPTALMEKVSRWLEINPGSSKAEVERAKLGKRAEFVRQAIDVLVAEEHVVSEKSGSSHRLTVVTPYRNDQQELPE